MNNWNDYEEDGAALGTAIAVLFVIVGLSVLLYFVGRSVGVW